MSYALEVALPVNTPRGRLGYYRCRLGAPLPTIAASVARAEGANVPGSIPARANNPGDLELGDVGYGTLTAAGGNQITIFPDTATGEAALESQLSKMIYGGSSVYNPSMTLAEAGQLYSGSSTWAQNVGSALEVDPNTTTLGELADSAGGDASGTTDSFLQDTESSLGMAAGSSTAAYALLAIAALSLYFILS